MPLSEVVTVLRRGATPKYVSERDTEFLAVNQKCVRNGRVSFEQARPAVPPKSIGERVLKVGDILVNSTGTGTLGRSAIFKASVRAFPDSHLTILRAGDGFDPVFISYSLLQSEDEIVALGVGSTGQTELSPTALGSLNLFVPPLPEQRRIAGVLGALDDLIDTNEQLSGRLQRSMSAHYSRVSQQATYVGPIGEFVKTAARGVTPKYSDGDGAVLVLNQKCIRNGLVNLNSARLMQPRPAKPEKVVQPGDAVVNSTGVGTLGRAARWVGAEPIFVDSHVTVVKPADSEESGWVARALVESLADIEALAQGSTGQTELSRDQLLSLSVAVPPKSIRVQASRLFDELDASIEVLATENDELRQTRDELLPLLMSGKIRVREAEELVKERVG